MGGTSSKGKGLDGVISRAESRVGKINVSGRYHRLPKKLEQEYNLSTKVLGSGYNGQVHMAERKSDGQKVAVKAFKLHGVSKDKKDELELELEIFLAMDHPHVARLVDVYESEEKLELVMECMSGGELFQRVVKEKCFSERNGADAAWQMLLAINYIHSHGIVHRDIKLENFLYENSSYSHLKLIDFGFSKIWAPNTKMSLSCGTLAYVAPEVLEKNYDSKCDMWSLGVTIFIMLFGYMPFSGSEEKQMRLIKEGKYNVKKDVWAKVSSNGQDFVRKFLVKNPKDRISADEALKHTWIADRQSLQDKAAVLDSAVVDALCSFSKASNLRRKCMSMMAWSLSAEERAQVRDAFIELDVDKTGTIKMHEFRSVLENKFHISDEEVSAAFKALDTNHDEEIHYSDFLAAMSSARVGFHGEALKQTFKRFDTDNSGFISEDNLKEVLGSTCSQAEIKQIIKEADKAKDGKISYDEWLQYLQGGNASSAHTELAANMIDKELQDTNKTMVSKGAAAKTVEDTKSTGCHCSIQ